MIVNCIFIFLTTLVLALLSIKKLIYVSHKKHLFDEPSEERKIHKNRTPNLGGVAIFSSMMFTSFLFLPNTSIHQLKYLIISSFIIFILGLTDDLVGVNPIKKIIPQLGVALLTTLWGNSRFTSFYDFLGLTEMPFGVSIFVSVFFILLLINAFNLIDGINCLAGSIGLLACLIFAYFFWKMQETGLLFLSIAMCGCLAGFLFYNRTPAKIFMGDTGSLFLGFIVSVLAINLIELNETHSIKESVPTIKSSPAFIFGLLIIPIFDTLRVFLLRLSKGRSPFSADRNHIHHRLLDLNLSHLQITGILLLLTIISFSFVLFFPNFSTTFLCFVIFTLTLVFNSIVSLLIDRKGNTLQKINPKKNIFDFEKLLYQEETSPKNAIQGTNYDETAKVIELKKPPQKVSGAV